MATLKQKFAMLPNGDVDIEAWLTRIHKDYAVQDVSIYRNAAEFAKNSSKGLTTFYGQPCIEQGLEMAEILLDMKLDQDGVTAAIISSAALHTRLPIDTIEETLGEKVAKLITGVLQMNVLNQLQSSINISRDPIQIDRLRKTFLAMISDIRVVLIKLAERTCMMRSIKNINPNERKHIAQETMDIYAPLANRLGIGQLKWELEDVAFHYIDPETYKTIADFLAERRVDREQRIKETIARLKETLKKIPLQAEVSGRAKHIYSIYHKMQRKHLDLKNIYDCSAVRILVPKISDCYTALSAAHDLWTQIPEEFDDYISHPKPNGYRSIHTAVIGPLGKNLEIQIRTHDMHNESEHGFAAHWLYKENKTHQSGYEAKIAFMRQLLAWHKDVSQESPDKMPESMLEDRVYVFTPAGEILELPVGATPLDFAYTIHTQLGHRCRGAKINGHIVPLTHHLSTGDQVEIITTQHGTPSRDWIRKDSGYIKTSRARSKVAHWFKQQDLSQQTEPVKQPETPHSPTQKIMEPIAPTKYKETQQSGMQVAGIHDLLMRIARCCKPIPGDDVIGYITQGRGVTVHRLDCNNMADHIRTEDERILQVTWDDKQHGSYYVDLQIGSQGQKETGKELFRELAALLANAKIDLISLNSTVSKKNNMIYTTVTIQIHDLIQLKNLVTQISHLPKVINVKRMSE